MADFSKMMDITRKLLRFLWNLPGIGFEIQQKIVEKNKVA